VPCRNPAWSAIRLAILFACMAVVVVLAWGWAASARGSRSIYLSRDATENASAMVFLHDGAMRVSHWWFNPQPRPAGVFAKAFLGFGIHFENAITPQGKTLIIQRFWVPIWFGMLVFMLPPLIALWRGPLRRHRRRREGLCPRCGYNLAGNISGRCTECGATCPRPLDPTVFVHARRFVRVILVSAFSLCTLVMLAAWTISYVRPFSNEWATESYDSLIAKLGDGALTLLASKVHEQSLSKPFGRASSPGRWNTGILGLDYSEYTGEPEFAGDGARLTMKEVLEAGAAQLGASKLVFATGWSLTVPLWIPSVLAILLSVLLLFRPIRRYRRSSREPCAQEGNDSMNHNTKVCSGYSEHP